MHSVFQIPPWFVRYLGPQQHVLPLAQAALAQEPEAGLALQKLVSLRGERGLGLKMCVLSSCQFVQKQCHLLPALPHLLFSPSLPRGS